MGSKHFKIMVCLLACLVAASLFAGVMGDIKKSFKV